MILAKVYKFIPTRFEHSSPNTICTPYLFIDNSPCSPVRRAIRASGLRSSQNNNLSALSALYVHITFYKPNLLLEPKLFFAKEKTFFHFTDKLVCSKQNVFVSNKIFVCYRTVNTVAHLSLHTLLHTLSLFSQTYLLSLLPFSETPQLHSPTESHASGCGTVEGSCRSNGQVCSSKAMQPRWSSLEEVAESQRSCGLQRMCGSVGDHSTACLVWYGPCLVWCGACRVWCGVGP